MIIVKTKNGDKFVNDKNIISLEHNRERKTVTYWAVDRKHGNGFLDVEAVIYTNDVQPTSWQDEGSDIKRMKERLDDQRREAEWLSKCTNELRKALNELANEIVGASFCKGDIPRGRFDRLYEISENITKNFVDEQWRARQQFMAAHEQTIAHDLEEEMRLKEIIEGLREELGDLREYNLERRAEINRLMARNLWQRIINKPVNYGRANRI